MDNIKINSCDIGIIGYGEIGSSLHKVYSNDGKHSVGIVDPHLGYENDLHDCKVLNICIPFIPDFVNVVNNYINEIKPNITVIHSTVAPGTTSQISGKVCHSPVRGLHPNLDTGIKTFVKYIGSEDYSVSQEYASHLHAMGIKSQICKSSKTTEYAKLLDTTYYGVCIAFHADVMRLCEDENLDFDEVMTLYNKTYNEGYSALGKSNVVRPVLYGTNKIGGHCVVPNALILQDYMQSGFIDQILKYR
jgi:UDP-N-acetyl-D-mannosaminuronate dehydrogenase